MLSFLFEKKKKNNYLVWIALCEHKEDIKVNEKPLQGDPLSAFQSPWGFATRTFIPQQCWWDLEDMVFINSTPPHVN